jgi:hypothetical protein
VKSIYYLHIPKTGGQTLARRLASAFPPERVDVLGPGLHFPRDIERFSRLLQEKQFVERHCDAGTLPDTVRNADILTTVREPWVQMASRYLHILREPRTRLHRAASVLSMQAFFLKFGDLLGNNQSATLISAFHERKACNSIDWARPGTWFNLIDGALDRIRWVVPTESIDDFVGLWQLETRLRVPYPSGVANVADRDDRYDALLDLCRDTSDRYHLDLVLWQTARRRYCDYRRELLGTAVPWDGSADASRAYWDGTSGIWLLNGWHFPESHDSADRQWWAGPSSRSEVAFVRGSGQRFLHFSASIFCGIGHEDIWVTSDDGKRELPVVGAQRGDSWGYWIDLQDEPARGSIEIRVPRVLAPMLVDPESHDSRRLSFAARGWTFGDTVPGDARPLPTSTTSGIED